MRKHNTHYATLEKKTSRIPWRKKNYICTWHCYQTNTPTVNQDTVQACSVAEAVREWSRKCWLNSELVAVKYHSEVA